MNNINIYMISQINQICQTNYHYFVTFSHCVNEKFVVFFKF